MRAYTVVRGDNLSRIARAFGLSSWRDLYHDPANAQFRALRPNPNLIFPGDRLQIPDREMSAITPQRRQAAATRSRALAADPSVSASTAIDADELDLARAEQQALRDSVRTSRALARTGLRSQVLAWVDRKLRLRSDLQSDGVIAVVFGEAAVYGPAGPQWQTEFRSLRPRIVMASRRHNGTALRGNSRVSTADNQEAVVLFLDSFSVLVATPNTLVAVYPPSNRPARRRTSPAYLETGNLREALHGLRGN
ncbi:MAG: LysM domain-containing protein [Pseudomonadota bacterium]